MAAGARTPAAAAAAGHDDERLVIFGKSAFTVIIFDRTLSHSSPPFKMLGRMGVAPPAREAAACLPSTRDGFRDLRLSLRFVRATL